MNPQPQIWTIPAEPGPHTTHVRDALGRVWARETNELDEDLGDEWVSPARERLYWYQLLGWAPLVDATHDHQAADQP